jgi:hypothetical protein
MTGNGSSLSTRKTPTLAFLPKIRLKELGSFIISGRGVLATLFVQILICIRVLAKVEILGQSAAGTAFPTLTRRTCPTLAAAGSISFTPSSVGGTCILTGFRACLGVALIISATHETK